ncbi:MAG: cytochrome C oxidase subunit IV family protein [Thermanaerothrix sp.]|jgi:cytochrome c oxidase subunit 4|uniref:Cytochrome C oxidase subunit IV family protein n=1 Tax=Thermanaerothrix solaris TaxID=3058434 RepID=A0ABU3NK44_9CHLR|nr:cytochrome C oxidase subunit IV family protein [Thermanaerothrix sp. 4228-RoL]MDT8896695.1 cytochrome C oxidase subunit IV family protein [Thermanaerothrix sp. 4228-RoL]
MKTSSKAMSEVRRGVVVFIVLAVLTGIEYYVGIHEAPSVILWAIALLKAAVVIQFYMHLMRIFRSQEEH